MGKAEQEIEKVLEELLSLVVPEGMSAKERNQFAGRAGISPETLRTNIKRKTLNATTLIRLLLARGISPKTIIDLPQTEHARLSKGESDWLKFGRELGEDEKVEFVSLLKVLRSKWKLK